MQKKAIQNRNWRSDTLIIELICIAINLFYKNKITIRVSLNVIVSVH